MTCIPRGFKLYKAELSVIFYMNIDGFWGNINASALCHYI